MRRNRELALLGRSIVAEAVGCRPPCPDSMVGSMAALPLPDGPADELQQRLLRRYAIEVPVIPWPAAPRRLVRLSAQLYNAPEEYRRLAAALAACSAP
jgi:isopenicillin-N epimerase